MAADDANEVKEAVSLYFDLYSETAIGLILPDGWFGKPYDNIYELTAINFADDGLVEIDLGWGWKVSFYPRGVSVSDNFLELIVRGEDISASSISASKRYDGGDIRFVVSEKSQFARTASNEASDLLSRYVR